MGIFSCARRTTSLGSKQSEAALSSENGTHELKDGKKCESEVTAVPLPTKSWTAILKETPLNPRAKEFKPVGLCGRQQKLPPGLEPTVWNSPGLEPHGKQITDPASVDKVSLEGMLCLSREFQRRLGAGSAPVGPQSPYAPPGLEPPVWKSPGPRPQSKFYTDFSAADKDALEWMKYCSKHFHNQLVAKSAPTLPPGLHSPPGLPAPTGLEPPASDRPALEPQSKLRIDLTSADKHVTECRQYYSKTVQNEAVAQSVDAWPPGNLAWKNYGYINRPFVDVLCSRQAAHNTNSTDSDVTNLIGVSPVSLVIHREKYLKISTEGKSESCGAQSTNGKVVGSKGKLGKGTCGGSVKIRRPPGKADPSGRELVGIPAPPDSGSGLAKNCASALEVDAAVGNAPTEDGSRPTTQDDIGIEKKLLDQDLSALAYWSETECIACKGPSAHRLGRLPRTSKRAPYVMQDLSFDLDRAVGMLLLRLQRLIDHQKVFNREGSRRFVMGLNCVARRAKRSRMDCMIVAPDVEKDAAKPIELHDRVHELLASAHEKNVPVIFALSRARLGQALGSSKKISAIGMLDTTGARELMAQCLHLANDCRQAWLSRHQTL